MTRRPEAQAAVTDYQAGRTLEVDPWRIIEREVPNEHRKKHETIFSLGNGYLGLRGSFEEGTADDPNSDRGAYVNGIYDYYPYVYNWRRTAYPPRGHSMLNVADHSAMRVHVCGKMINGLDADVADYERVLDMRRGVLTRSFLSTCPGMAARVAIERFASMARPNCVLYRYSVTPLDFDGEIVLQSAIDGNVKNCNWEKRALHTTGVGARGSAVFLTQRTAESGFDLAYAAVHTIAPQPASVKHCGEGETASTRITFHGKRGETYTLEKYVAVFDSRYVPPDQLVNAALREAERAAEAGFDALLKEHADYWTGFWNDADLQIEGDDAAQQGVRFALFQLAQSTGRDGKTNCGANGLTGEAYNGHVFWDSEMYIMPAFLYSRPEIARSMMSYRHHILPEARKRAKELEHEGACFSWESISGEECGWIFEAATDQYHLQSDIAYGVIKYHEATLDDEWLFEKGAEIIFDTAKCMAHRGAFIPLKGNKFCINVVCGPDEYTPAVDNNSYTNCMCKFHLEYAYNLAHRMAQEVPEKHAELMGRLGIDDVELELWKRAAENMYIGYDEELGITLQDDQFLYRDPVDVEQLKKRGYILMNMHPLNLWRFQVAKQADVVLLMLTLPHWFSRELKKANFDYYEPKTIHDSSLSPSIHSIIASEIGYHDKAYDYFMRTARMDLDDVKGNTAGGCHTACMGGSWMTIVYGFGGLRVYDGRVHLNPYVPEGWNSYSFKVLFRGSRVKVAVTKEATTLSLLEGDDIDLEVLGRSVALSTEAPILTVPLTA
jgi:alpha,alpha-trehalose phosphorylase